MHPSEIILIQSLQRSRLGIPMVTATNGAEIQANTNPGDATSFPTGGTADITLPMVSSFTIPTSSTSLTVSITTLTATDNVGVTGYLVNESATKPAAGNWAATPPASYTFATAGAKTLYAWAPDAVGNVFNALARREGYPDRHHGARGFAIHHSHHLPP